MTKATSVLSTPRQDASLPQAGTTRRQFAGWLAAATAAAGAVSAAPVASMPLAAASTSNAPEALLAGAAPALDGSKVSDELHRLVKSLQDADDALQAAEAEFDRKHEAYIAWEKKNRQPADGRDHRAWRKWDGRWKRYSREIGFEAARSAQVNAVSAFKDAQLAIARYRPRDTNELVHKACVSVCFEGKPHRPQIIATGVAYDVAALGASGRRVG